MPTTPSPTGYAAVSRRAAQCVSPAAVTTARSNRDWHPVAAEEYGYVVPDPLDPDIIYGGKLTRYDRRTGQAQNIMPVPLRSRGSASSAPNPLSSRRSIRT